MNAPLQIGGYPLASRVLLAPMAGITDGPFREICGRFGAALSVTEMTTADTRLWTSNKSRQRLRLEHLTGLRAVQLAGSDPSKMADAARTAVGLGAQIIDINMGCPAKKVCRRLAGSALLADEDQVARIIDAVVSATDAPVTLKMRTGPAPENRNGVQIARLAESLGVRAIAVHGRTRACKFLGHAEYDTIRAIKSAVEIPVIANGDINSPALAADVLEVTGADAVMVGRAARGRPWLIEQMNDYIDKKVYRDAPAIAEQRDIITGHLDAMYHFYGEYTGVRMARKHLGWYLQNFSNAEQTRGDAVRAENSAMQMKIIEDFFRHRVIGEDAVTV